MRWGLVPTRWNKPLKELKLATFNARSATVDTKPFFKTALKNQALPAADVRLFRMADAREGKQPWYFTAANGGLLTAAGLWDEWKNRETG